MEQELEMEQGSHPPVADLHVPCIDPIAERFHEEVHVTVIFMLPLFASPRELNQRSCIRDRTVRLGTAAPVTPPPNSVHRGCIFCSSGRTDGGGGR